MTNRLFRSTFGHKESNGNIISDKEEGIKTAISSIKHHRSLLDEYAKKHPLFIHSFEPVTVKDGPEVVQLMAEAAERAGVGPMAAVAGVFADLAVKEASAISNKPIDIAFAAGEEPLSKEMGFRLKNFPIGVATSSGRFSHAFSFGDAEAVTIFAVNAGFADAAATAVANLIVGDKVQDVIRQGLDLALNIIGVKGAFILYRGMVGKAGEIPELIKLTK
jgi:ApbE superfamily uncharacterized protein (UPF0280 family)